jgi:serine phosphatase RsbU (regulator of sigma subunit)
VQINSHRKKQKSSISRLLKVKYSGRSIARDLAVHLVTALSLSLLLVGILGFFYQTTSDDKELRTKVRGTVNSLAEYLAFPVWTYNEFEINSLVDRYGSSEDITRILLTDDSGQIISNFKKKNRREDIVLAKDITYKRKKIGRLTVFASTESLYSRAIKTFVITIISIILAISVVSLMILPLLNKFLDEPLLRLVSGIKKIASGRYKESLPDVPQVELARITEEVNFMAEKIALRESQIKESMRASTVLKTEIGMAETVQRSMTATQGFNTARRVAQYYQPMTNLSGDWMTVFECDHGNTIYAMVGDVTGHGIPQGLVTMAAFGAIQTLRPLVQQNSRSFSPATILNILRSTLVTVLHECQLAMTISIIKIDIKARSLTMSSAGHPLPLVVRRKHEKMGVAPLIAKAQSPLGFEMLTKSIAVPPFVDTSHEIEPDDMILIFSDGLTEAKNNSNLAFQKQFLSTLRCLDRRYPPTVVMDRILQSLQNHMGSSRLADDICLLIIDTKKEDSYESVA